jgi:hypothetical protein
MEASMADAPNGPKINLPPWVWAAILLGGTGASVGGGIQLFSDEPAATKAEVAAVDARLTALDDTVEALDDKIDDRMDAFDATLIRIEYAVTGHVTP